MESPGAVETLTVPPEEDSPASVSNMKTSGVGYSISTLLHMTSLQGIEVGGTSLPSFHDIRNEAGNKSLQQ